MATSEVSSKPKRKLALIIGNDSYSDKSNRLRHSVNNAVDLGELLKTLNFTVKMLANVDAAELQQTIKRFSEDSTDDDLIFFYYSGHTHSVNGIDYLITIDDVSLNTDLDVKATAMSFQDTLNLLTANAKPYAVAAILDCSTNYRLGCVRDGKEVQKLNGMRRLNPPRGSIIQFACDTDQCLNDALNGERNSIYTKALLEHLQREMVDVRKVFKFIEDDVYQLSDRKQRPVLVNALPRNQQVFINDIIKKPRLKVEDFISNTPLSPTEKGYFDECKEFYNLTQQTLVSVAEEVLSDQVIPSSMIFKLGIDENCYNFDLQKFLDCFCKKIGLNQDILRIKRIQKGSSIIEAEIPDKFDRSDIKIKLKMIYKSLTDSVREELALIKLFFLYMGPVESLGKIQKFRSEIKLNPSFNRTYVKGQNYWEGPLCDNLDRGGNPYYCPAGWKRWSFYVTDNFYGKFKGWSICYHGTKFDYGLAILLSGLKPAVIAAHGGGIYATPSINYACHPRYAQVKKIEPSKNDKLFKTHGYVQFVLECRVHPRNIKRKRPETLGVSKTIDGNMHNDVIEWLIDSHGKDLVDFNDPDASIVCSGIMVRITDNHPGLLRESNWWFYSHLCNFAKCCTLGIDLEILKKKRQNQEDCNIILS